MRLGAIVGVCLAGAAVVSSEKFTWVFHLADGQSGACKRDGKCDEEGDDIVELSGWVSVCAALADPNCHYDIIFDTPGFREKHLVEGCAKLRETENGMIGGTNLTEVIGGTNLTEVAEISSKTLKALDYIGDVKGAVIMNVKITPAKEDCQVDNYLSSDVQCSASDMKGTHILSNVTKESETFEVSMDFDSLTDLDKPWIYSKIGDACGSTVDGYTVKSVQFKAGFNGINPLAAGVGCNLAIGLLAGAAGVGLTFF